MSTVLPEHILKRLAPEDRAKLGKAGITAEEAERKWADGEEHKMHTLFATDCQRRGWLCIRSRMDKRPTIRKGWPDFTVLHGSRVCCVEFKAGRGKPSKDQEECIAELQSAGVPVLVAYDLKSAIDFATAQLANGRITEGARA